VILWLTLGASCHGRYATDSSFPPCSKASEEELEAIRSLGREESQMERDQLILDFLGRLAQFCRAHNARIGM